MGTVRPPVPSIRPTSVRWRLLSVAFVVCFVAYLLRMNISVAAKFMMPELGLSNLQMGWVFSAFVWGYAIFQFPGGVLCDCWGPRRTITIVTLLWGVLSILTGLVPGPASASAVVILSVLIGVRFLMGAVQAPLFPSTAGVIAQWFPVAGWALPNALLSTGLGLGAAFTPPLVAWLMVRLGWRESFFITAPIAFLVIGGWWWYARDAPSEHAAVNAGELRLTEPARPAELAGVDGRAWRLLLRNRETLLLTFSYLCMNYVFYIFFSWFYIYLVDVRQFSLLEGGFAASLPFLVGSIAAALGGLVCDGLCRRIGPRWGCRLPCIVGMGLVAVLLFAGARAESPYWAVGFLSLCFGFTQFTEGAYWSGATFVAGPHTAAATGILNTGGNLGGVISTPLIPVLVSAFGWLPALATGSVFALIGGLAWFWIRVDRPFVSADDPGTC